jgi:endonuclease G, mitochondrial
VEIIVKNLPNNQISKQKVDLCNKTIPMAKQESGGFLFKTGIFAVLAGIAYWAFNSFGGKADPLPQPDTGQEQRRAEPTEKILETQVPTAIFPNSTSPLVVHTWFGLGYSEDHEQAEWVAYELTRERLNDNWAARKNIFQPDPLVHTESATPRDYMSSGYDKGHLCPAVDMAFMEQAIDETFFMSNMSPQVPGFNAGIWRELEELTRDWARKYKKMYITTGPVLTRTNLGAIGFSKVTVPGYFYKVLYAPDQEKAIGFILPNQVSTKPVMDYACSIDQVEKITGIDFYPQLLKGLSEELEASLDKTAWPVNENRYKERVEDWNKL